MPIFNKQAYLHPNEYIHVQYAHNLGLYGTGVGVAVLDTGICSREDFQGINSSASRIKAFVDFVNHRQLPYDDQGHGSHICGKIASCHKINNAYLGIAPNCNLTVLKILDSHGDAPLGRVLQALRWLKEHHTSLGIRIVNISIGTNPNTQSGKSKALSQAVEDLWDEGLVVCASAGNHGPLPNSISAPGNCCKIITVGSCDPSPSSHASKEQVLYSGSSSINYPCIKPDIVAPGSNILSCTPYKIGYKIKTGTSMSTAIVSGAIALLLEAEPSLTNKEIKSRLHKSAKRLNLPNIQQGFGLLDIPSLLNPITDYS